MTISTILEELPKSIRPVARAIHSSEHSRTLCIGFLKGMRLTEHKTKRQTTLLVIQGSIIYIEGENSIHLKQFDEHEIPVEVLHEVEALEDSLILLFQD